MTQICWWLTDIASRMYPRERDAVLVDLAEAGETGAQALRDLLGLVVGRQSTLLKRLSVFPLDAGGWKVVKPFLATPMCPTECYWETILPRGGTDQIAAGHIPSTVNVGSQRFIQRDWWTKPMSKLISRR